MIDAMHKGVENHEGVQASIQPLRPVRFCLFVGKFVAGDRYTRRGSVGRRLSRWPPVRGVLLMSRTSGDVVGEGSRRACVGRLRLESRRELRGKAHKIKRKANSFGDLAARLVYDLCEAVRLLLGEGRHFPVVRGLEKHQAVVGSP